MWVVCGTVLPSFLVSWIAVRYVRRLAHALAVGGSAGPAQGAHDADADGRRAGDLAGRGPALRGRAAHRVAAGFRRPGGPMVESGDPGVCPSTPGGTGASGRGAVGAAGRRHAADDRGPAGRSVRARLAAPIGPAVCGGDRLCALARLAAHRVHRRALDHVGLVGDLDCGAHQLVQHAGQHGRAVGGRGRDCGHHAGRRVCS